MAEPNERSTLHPAEHRGYRELYLTSRQLLSRWRRVADALRDTPVAAALQTGAAKVTEMLAEVEPLTEARGLPAGPAAQGAGATLAHVRTAVVDRSVDTGLAARMAVLDIEHVASLLLQLAELGLARDDAELASFCARWAERLRPAVDDARGAAAALGADPDRAAAPLDRSLLGQAIHRAGWAVGTVGEWLDRQVTGAGGEDDPTPEATRKRV
jgi:hypothetical protein